MPCAAFTILAAFWPIMIVGALLFPDTMLGITDASATRKRSTPCTRSSGSTTDP